MSGVEFKNFRFDPNTSLMSDADEETNDSPSMLTNGSLKNDSSELNVTKDVSEIDKSDDDDEEELIGRTARKARVRARYVMSDSDASDYENGADDSIEDNPEDPSFGATRKQHRMNRLPAAIRRAINKPANKAQVVTIPALRKESDDYRPLKVIDKGIGKESSNDAISKRNVIMLNDSSNESSSLPTSQIDDLQSMLNDDTSSTSRSNDRWLANPSNKVNGIETPKRKKAK